jgi:peptidoglycan/LPS O-acetylase OafA/YrhL
LTTEPLKRNFLAAALADLKTRPPGNVPCLDVLRSAAILLVFSGHMDGCFGEQLAIGKLPFIYWGWTGVDLFFILSGYLIGGQLWKELNRTGDIQVLRFILRRGFRIWPLFYSVLLLALVTALLHSRPLTGVWADLFFVSNYTGLTNVGGSWSLCIEEQFYIAVPLVFWLGRHLVAFQRLAVVPALWLIALPLFRARMFHLHREVNGSLFEAHSDGLAIGLLIAWVAVLYPKWMRSSIAHNALLFLGILALAAVLHKLNRPMFAYSSLALLYGGSTFFLLRLPASPAWFNWPGFYLISRLSYGIYLNHFLVLEYLPKAVKPFVGKHTTGFILCSFLALFVSGSIAFLTFAGIELPFLRIREHFLAKRRQMPA